MSVDGAYPGPPGSGDANPRNRRGSITQVALSNLFQRTGPSASGPPFPGQPSPAITDPQRRRLSVSTIGLSGNSPNGAAALNIRRGSMSTNSNNSDSIDESAIEDDEFSPRTAPTTPFTRRMSFGGNSSMRGFRPGGSPGHDQPGFNWPEQLRSRAESHVAGGQRPSFSMASSPPQYHGFNHDRAKSVSDMPAPPNQAPAPKPVQERPKPDAFQERILKGDFYMD